MRFSDSWAASKIVLDDGRVITKCDQCREVWAERNQRGVDGSPPCDECRVNLKKENEIPAEIYRLVRGQVRFYFNGECSKVADIDHNAVWNMIDHYPKRISDPWKVFNRIIHTYHSLKKEQDGNQG